MFPRLVIDAGAGQRDHRGRAVHQRGGGRRAGRAGARAAGRSRRPGCGTWPSTSSGQQVWQIASQAASAERDSTTLMGAVALGGDYARVRTDTVLAGQGASARQIAVFFAERTRCTTSAPSRTRRTPHHQRPAVQGRRRRAVAQRLHRPHRDRPRGQGGERVPDQPQPHAERRGVGGERAEPGHRDQRREVQPRHPRSARSTRSSGSTSRAVACRRSSPSGSSCSGSSTRCSTSCRRRPLVPELRAPGRRQARPEGRVMPTAVRVGLLADLAPGDGPAGRCRRARRRARAHRRRRLRHRRHLQPRRRLAAARARCCVEDREIECWKHGSTFSLETGEPQTLPATQPVPVYEARVEDGEIVVVVRGSSDARRRRVRATRSQPMTVLEISGLRASAGGNEILHGIDLTVVLGRGPRRDGPERRRQVARSPAS